MRRIAFLAGFAISATAVVVVMTKGLPMGYGMVAAGFAIVFLMIVLEI